MNPTRRPSTVPTYDTAPRVNPGVASTSSRTLPTVTTSPSFTQRCTAIGSTGTFVDCCA